MVMVDLRALEARARDNGEAFLTISASQSYRVGVLARWEGGILTWALECQLRLLPPRSEVDLDTLRSTIDTMAQIVDSGLTLFHHEEGWVVATRNINLDDLPTLIERVIPLFLA